MKRIIFLGLFIFVSCFSDQKVLVIGRFEISKEDILLRERIIQIFYPGNKTPGAGLVQLADAYTLAAVLENNGHIISEQKLKEESLRIDASSRDTETLNRIKDVFRNDNRVLDVPTYRRVFILPVYAERILPSFFQSLPLHEKTREKAESLFVVARARPQNFRSLVKEKGILFGEWCVSYEDGLIFTDESAISKKKKVVPSSVVDHSKIRKKDLRDSVQGQMASDQDALVKKWFDEIITPTSPGSIVPHIVDYYSSWLILRLSFKTQKRACFEAASVQKEIFESWLQKEKARIRVSK